MSIRVGLLGVCAAGLLVLSGPAFASAPQASAPAADVASLVTQIRSAVETARTGFTPNESESDKEAAIQAAMSSAIASSGFDAVTAQAALQSIANNTPTTTPVGQASRALLATVTPAAQQEAAAAGSTGGGAPGGGSGGGGFGGGSGGGSGGGGGYVVSH